MKLLVFQEANFYIYVLYVYLDVLYEHALLEIIGKIVHP